MSNNTITNTQDRDFNGNKQMLSSWQPDDKWKDLLANIWNDVQIGNNNLTAPRIELDNRSQVVAFWSYYNAFIGSTRTHASNDPESSWQSYMHKPIIMSKSQILIAHTVANMIYPAYIAQNENSSEDDLKSNVLQLLGDYVFDDPDFAQQIVTAVTAVTFSPVVIVEKGYDDGKHWVKLVDMTTFKYANYWERDVQKQRFVIKDERIDYFDAQALYGNHPNWKHINPGQDCYLDVVTYAYYYSTIPSDQRNTVRRLTYYNKAKDLKITLINGIPVCNIDEKIPRLGKKKKRAYPFATLVYENLGRNTFVGRPFAQKLWADEVLASGLQSMTYDMTKQAVAPTKIVWGSDNLTARDFGPGTIVNAGNNKNFKVENITNGDSLQAAYNMLEYLSRQDTENTNIDALRGGITGSGSTAREVVIANENAKIVSQGTFAKNLDKFMQDIGALTMDDIFQFDLVKTINKSTNNIEYKSALIINTDNSTKNEDKILIKFADNTFESPEERLQAEVALADLIERDNLKTIYQINPKEYQEIDFYVRTSVERAVTKNKELQKALATEFYQVTAMNPYIDQVENTRQLVKQYYPERVHELVKAPEQPQPQAQSPGDLVAQMQNTQKKMPTTNQLLNNTIDTITT